MKRLMTSLILTAGLMTALAVYAGPGYGHPGGKGHIEFMAKKLDLTEEQKAAIEEIHRSYGGPDKDGRKQHRHQVMRAFAELDPTAADYQERVAEIAHEEAAKVEQAILQRGEIHAKVYSVLTPEQREKMKAMHEMRKSRNKDD